MTHIEELMVGEWIVRCGMTSSRAFSHLKTQWNNRPMRAARATTSVA